MLPLNLLAKPSDEGFAWATQGNCWRELIDAHFKPIEIELCWERQG